MLVFNWLQPTNLEMFSVVKLTNMEKFVFSSQVLKLGGGNIFISPLGSCDVYWSCSVVGIQIQSHEMSNVIKCEMS